MKGSIGFLLFVAGAGLGVLGSARYFKSKYEKEAEEEIQSVRDYYTKRRRIMSTDVEVPEWQPKAQPEVPLMDHSSITTGVSDPRAYEDLTDYARRSKPYRSTVEDITDRLAESESPSEEAPKRQQPPKLISKEKFGDDERYTPRSAYYYTLSDTVTIIDEDTDDEEQVEDDELVEMFGDCLTRYGFKENNEDVIYIRNVAKGVDYEVIKVRSYYEP